MSLAIRQLDVGGLRAWADPKRPSSNFQYFNAIFLKQAFRTTEEKPRTKYQRGENLGTEETGILREITKLLRKGRFDQRDRYRRASLQRDNVSPFRLRHALLRERVQRGVEGETTQGMHF